MASTRRGQVISKQLVDGARRGLRQITASWMGRDSERPPDDIAVGEDGAHTYSFTANSGEMNHAGHLLCDTCENVMQVRQDEAGSLVWECAGCGRRDDQSFRVCHKCGALSVPDKWAAGAGGVPVSLNAGGCTACERCIICDGVLALGNLLWFTGRWTHTYPSPEFDRKTGEEITVMRERSKYYGFHAHHSCQARGPQSIEQIIKDRTPDWFKQGEAEQARADTGRLQREHRCAVCRNPLSLWDRLMEHEKHKGCE